MTASRTEGEKRECLLCCQWEVTLFQGLMTQSGETPLIFSHKLSSLTSLLIHHYTLLTPSQRVWAPAQLDSPEFYFHVQRQSQHDAPQNGCSSKLLPSTPPSPLTNSTTYQFTSSSVFQTIPIASNSSPCFQSCPCNRH